MKVWHALPLVMLVATAAPLRAAFVSYSFTAQVMLVDDAGHRVPGLQGGSLLTGTIRFENGVSGITSPAPETGFVYPGNGAAITFNANGIQLGSGAAPITLSVTKIPASQFSPTTLFAFNMQAQSTTATPSLFVAFGMSKQVAPPAVLDYSLKDLHLDFNHFDGGYLFYNYQATGSQLIGSSDQLLIESQVVSITADSTTLATPEPAAWTLFGLGSLALAGIGWRRHRLSRSSMPG